MAENLSGTRCSHCGLECHLPWYRDGHEHFAHGQGRNIYKCILCNKKVCDTLKHLESHASKHHKSEYKEYEQMEINYNRHLEQLADHQVNVINYLFPNGLDINADHFEAGNLIAPPATNADDGLDIIAELKAGNIFGSPAVKAEDYASESSVKWDTEGSSSSSARPSGWSNEAVVNFPFTDDIYFQTPPGPAFRVDAAGTSSSALRPVAWGDDARYFWRDGTRVDDEDDQ